MKRKLSCWILVLASAFMVPLVSAQTLEVQRLRDGTGAVSAPKGWQQTDAYRGSVTLQGPDGTTIRLGFPITVTAPYDPVTGWPASPSTQVAVAPVGDIEGAVRSFSRNYGVKIIGKIAFRPAPRAVANAPAYYLFYDLQSGGKTYTAICYATPLVYPNTGIWQLYTSTFVARKELFAKNLPLGVRIWQSWRPNGQEPDKGSQSELWEKLRREKWKSHAEIQKQFRENL